MQRSGPCPDRRHARSEVLHRRDNRVAQAVCCGHLEVLNGSNIPGQKMHQQCRWKLPLQQQAERFESFVCPLKRASSRKSYFSTCENVKHKSGKPRDCPDELLLFMHHVPYTHVLHSGKTIIQHIYDTHYEGAEDANQFVRQWESLKGRVDAQRYHEVLNRLEYQAGHAQVWRDAVCNWFLRMSGIPDVRNRAGNFPGRVEAEAMKLEGYHMGSRRCTAHEKDGCALFHPAPDQTPGAPSSR